MKKAKRLLAVLLAVVMLFSAASVQTYAYLPSNNWHEPGEDNEMYYFTYAQGCGYLLDMLDDLLADAAIYITMDELNALVKDLTKVLNGVVDGGTISLNIGERIRKAGGATGDIDITSIDSLIYTLYGVLDCLDNSSTLSTVNKIADLFGYNILGDLNNYLNMANFNNRCTRATASDEEVLEMLITWICNQSQLLEKAIAGTLYWGDVLPDLIIDLLPGVVNNGGHLENIDGALKSMLYTMLVDDSVESIPAGETIDTGLQKVINWALVTGTGYTAETGANSLLGENTKPLMPGMEKTLESGGASITAIPIKADRNLDGIPEDCTMSTYQLVSNLLDCLMGGMLGPILSELLYDLFEIEITEQYPYGDPAIMGDQMFSLIIGLVESLLVQNGAPAPEYSEDENKYPALKVDAIIDWLFNGGGLEAFITINYQGIGLTDNFMSLLNDLVRLLINMLPSLGLFASAAHLSYSPDELNAIWYYNDAKQLVAEGTEGAIDITYVTYETGDIVYATEYQTINEVVTPVAFNYLATDMPLNTSNAAGEAYANPDFIRSNYVIATKQIYATLIKMLLYDMVDGCYFPEWTTDIPSVLAYGLAALAAPAVPENNFYARLDAYHELTLNGGVGVVVDADGDEIDPIPYTTTKVIVEKDANGNPTGVNRNVVVPSGALSIGCSYLAAYLNTILKLSGNNLSTDTTMEQFAGEFLLWACQEYIPMLAGEDKTGDLLMDNEAMGTWAGAVNNYVRAVYQADDNGSYGARKYKETANFDAVYDLIDATLFSLLPTSWLPGITGSNQFVNEWLLGNLVEFDLQGILSLFSVNMDPTAELNKPLLEVILLVIDRVLAVVFNDEGLLLPDGRKNVVKTKNYTSIKTLDALLSSKDVNGNPSEQASLPVLIKNLLKHLNTYKKMMLETILPFLVSNVYEKPYRTDVLGTNMKKYKIEDLENYIDSFSDNINATALKTFNNEDDANAAAAGDAVVQRVVTTDDAGNIIATTYQVKLNNGTVYESYSAKEDAEAVVELLKDAYVDEVVTVNEETDEATSTYTVYARWSYLDTATSKTKIGDDATKTDHVGHAGSYYDKYDGFQYANLANQATSSTPLVAYETGYQRFFAYEDWGESGFYYAAVNNAIKDGNSFVSDYYNFAESTLPDAYGEWFMYSVKAQLRAKDRYDENDDGRSVISEDTSIDGDYVAPTTNDSGEVTNPGFPVDGDPAIPSAVYPFATTDTTAFAFENTITGEMVTVNMSDLTAANFEQIAMALEYGSKEKNDVRFSDEDVESIVRLALNTVDFDITPRDVAADGTPIYNAGSMQWSHLEADAALPDGDANKKDYFGKITTWCANNGLTCGSETLEDGSVKYWIARPAFALLTPNLALNGVSAKPITNDAYTSTYGKISMLSDSNPQGKVMTYADDVIKQIHHSYEEYVETLYTHRTGIYNRIDLISYRYERAETNRIKTADTTMLQWIKDLSYKAYWNDNTKLRNYKYTGDVDFSTGELAMTKIYTSSSFAKFQAAYEYADSLINEVGGETLAVQNEFTQSLVTEAYIGLLEAYLGLVDYTGSASWEQLDYYMGIAYDILTDEDRYDDVLGYEEAGLKILENTYIESDKLRNDANVDDERQTEVDNMAAGLRQAINALVYKTAPSLTNAKGATTKFHETSEDGAARIVGLIYGLKEGVGAVMDVVDVVGMRLDDSVGNILTITGSGKGNGTGSYYKGSIDTTNERFRYYAVLYGDINGDCRIDGTDASILELHIELKTTDQLDTAKKEAADAYPDGKIDESDVAAIVNHYTFVEKIEQVERTPSTAA